jgi:hypothetical protein
MQKVIVTPRLQLTRLEAFEEGSQDLADYHMLKTDPLANIWK